MTSRIAFAVVLAACGPAIPPLPSKGGPAWREYTSEHFTLWSDTSQSRAHELMRQMEDLRHVVIGIGFKGGGEGRVLVIALRDDYETKAFIPPGDFDAMASPSNSYINQPMIMMSAEGDNEVVAHELTHTISQTVIREQPRWFAEGLAKYFETLEFDRGRTMVDLGRPPTYEGQPMAMSRPLPLRQLVACKDLTCADEHFYVAAWALFTYLMNIKHADIATYIQLIATTNLDQLDDEMRRWLVNGSHQILHYNIKLPSYPVTERALTDADVHAIRGLLRLQFQEDNAKAKEQAEAALALDPTHVLASYIRYRIVKTITPEVARSLVTAHPDDWRAQMMLAWTLQHGEEAHAAWLRGCELAAQNPALVTTCETP